MHYGNSSYIPLVYTSVFALLVFYILVMKRRKNLMGKFADQKLMQGAAPSASAGKKIFKAILVSVALCLGLYALARPQWGFEWQEVKRSGLDILIAVDVSKSMLAQDIKPNRLERTKFAIKDLLRKLNGDRIGLIAFAGTAFLQCPLTIDYNGFLLTLDDLSTSTIPRPGTSISSAIREAIQVFKGPEKKYKALVIITDGEDLEGDALKAAGEAALAGIKIYCVGVGTAEGELIPAGYDSGERKYLADRSGNIVKTRLNEDILKRIAISTGGSYVHATPADFGLGLLYDKSISQMEKRDIETKMRKRYEERYQIFLAIALVLLFLEPLISDRRRSTA
ncbi:MAG: VWA domain-containing protein [Candidatus Omnitrophica bacterium]|nr:VWA domain-containing protein [Candidatus Omnitrophota bacterium]